MSQTYSQNIYYENINVNLMVKSVTRIKSGIMINFGVSAKTKRT